MVRRKEGVVFSPDARGNWEKALGVD